MMLPWDMVDLHLKDKVLAYSHTIMQNVHKKRSEELKRALRKATTLKGELKRKDDDLAVVAKECVVTARELIVTHAELDKRRREAAVKLPVAYSDPPEPYSPILLPGFDEKEYVSCPTKEDEDTTDGRDEVVEATIDSANSPALALGCLKLMLRIFFHGENLFGVRLVLDPSEKFLNWFFENYVDSLLICPSRSFVPSFHFLNMPSPQEKVLEAHLACLTSSSNRACIFTHVMRSRRSVRGLSIKSSLNFSSRSQPELSVRRELTPFSALVLITNRTMNDLESWRQLLMDPDGSFLNDFTQGHQARWKYPEHECIEVIPKGHHLPKVLNMRPRVGLSIIHVEFRGRTSQEVPFPQSRARKKFGTLGGVVLLVQSMVILASYLIGRIRFTADVALVISFTRKSPPYPHLVLRFSKGPRQRWFD
ncbi:hypothetical protein Acr_04g0002100 [Actinidia rufa]|uniref:Uncharacterized protein n=1 Tax=Actinidia rufa TaxID=165716 RepID=A0A7J0EGS4_9ERIC|nr:hypothetical protein Acr_04g0002100 [Actinidia rufa]